jgi:hypothetical protein
MNATTFTREDRDRCVATWQCAWRSTRGNALRGALILALCSVEQPTLLDLLAHFREDGCDLVGCPEVGEITLGQLLGGEPSGPSVNGLLEHLDLDSEAPLADALYLGIDLCVPLASFLVEPGPALQ